MSLCECAACHARDRLLFIYLMQNILTVVLNGIKEGKVYRELWTGPEKRGDMEGMKGRGGKEKEKMILVQVKTNMESN